MDCHGVVVEEIIINGIKIEPESDEDYKKRVKEYNRKAKERIESQKEQRRLEYERLKREFGDE